MEMNKRLKPRPFCGGAAELKEKYAMMGQNVQAYVRCKVCGSTSGYFGKSIAYCANEKAIEAWNRRCEQ